MPSCLSRRSDPSRKSSAQPDQPPLSAAARLRDAPRGRQDQAPRQVRRGLRERPACRHDDARARAASRSMLSNPTAMFATMRRSRPASSTSVVIGRSGGRAAPACPPARLSSPGGIASGPRTLPRRTRLEPPTTDVGMRHVRTPGLAMTSARAFRGRQPSRSGGRRSCRAGRASARKHERRTRRAPSARPRPGCARREAVEPRRPAMPDQAADRAPDDEQEERPDQMRASICGLL